MNRNSEGTRALDHDRAMHVAGLFCTLGDASRLRIVSVLLCREVNVGTLAEIVGMSGSSVSHHLRWLRQMRLVSTRQDGKEIYYRLDDDHIIALFRLGLKFSLENGWKQKRERSFLDAEVRSDEF